MEKTKYLFFSGKGGVGKTTMACATAVHYAGKGLKTLIITTDPASNLADVFETEIGHKLTPLGVTNLWGMEIDPDRATEEYRERILGPMRAVMPEEVMKVLEEQFNSPCTTEIASFDCFVGFMATDNGSDKQEYDVVIFDTAPTGHTIRLLELPVDWSKHIEESAKGSGATCIGPVASILESKEKYDQATRLLGDTARTTFFFVVHPEETAIYETQRSSEELRKIGIGHIELIVNGILPEEVCSHPFFKKRYDMQQSYLRRIESLFPVPARKMLLWDGQIKGFPALRHIAKALFAANGSRQGYRLSASSSYVTAPPEEFVGASVIDLMKPNGATKAIFFTGKGGVGKTTVSCAAAIALAQEGYRTLLLTTDPASHIGEVLKQRIEDTIQPVAGVEKLWAVIIDQEKSVLEYKRRILDGARGKYSEEMLAAVREELESPCTEEMAAFDKFMRYVESDEYEVAVFDTAPTGHTLRLLQLPFDYSDQVGLMVTTTTGSAAVKSETQMRFARVIERMKDPERSVLAFVVYPESTPVTEAYRAMLDLKEAGITAQFIVANQVLPLEYCTNEYFARRRLMQAKYLSEIRERFALPIAVMPLLEAEIRGIPMIQRTADELFIHQAEGVLR